MLVLFAGSAAPEVPILIDLCVGKRLAVGDDGPDTASARDEDSAPDDETYNPAERDDAAPTAAMYICGGKGLFGIMYCFPLGRDVGWDGMEFVFFALLVLWRLGRFWAARYAFNAEEVDDFFRLS